MNMGSNLYLKLCILHVLLLVTDCGLEREEKKPETNIWKIVETLMSKNLLELLAGGIFTCLSMIFGVKQLKEKLRKKSEKIKKLKSDKEKLKDRVWNLELELEKKKQNQEGCYLM
ncbi:unnamed protein product [Owenia fusiformis]|uniref:Uncharacterized protein n=1 Tax=Owenia fusiformis TaxID=6347 RepID=A0A8S4PTW2_OWEFU|nr:unnamed protein product [Owenia fusiformis]